MYNITIGTHFQGLLYCICYIAFLTYSKDSPPRLARKGQKNSQMWKRYINKNLRQAGQTYSNWRNQSVSVRKIKPSCSMHFSKLDQIRIFNVFSKFTNDEKKKKPI